MCRGYLDTKILKERLKVGCYNEFTAGQKCPAVGELMLKLQAWLRLSAAPEQRRFCLPLR